MIPITYSGNLSDYNHFVSYFKQELRNAIERGYIGNLVPINVGKANRTYRKLSGRQKEKYDEAIKKSGLAGESNLHRLRYQHRKR